MGKIRILKINILLFKLFLRKENFFQKGVAIYLPLCYNFKALKIHTPFERRLVPYLRSAKRIEEGGGAALAQLTWAARHKTKIIGGVFHVSYFYEAAS
jgi:hypothetical protein